MGPPAATEFAMTRRSCETVRAHSAALRRRARDLSRDAWNAHAALALVIESSRRTLGAVRDAQRARTGMLIPRASPSPQDALLRALAAAGLDAEGDLDALTDDLIAAHRDAAARDDDRLAALLGGVLREIGRHLAARLGPKAAGVRLN